jgi:hypothetical protein
MKMKGREDIQSGHNMCIVINGSTIFLVSRTSNKQTIKTKRRRMEGFTLFLYGVNAFAVASTEYVTVNLAPLSVWNATAFPTKFMLPDAIGLD